MRAFGCFILGVVAAVLVVAFGLFALENGQAISFSFLGNTMRMSLWLVVGIPAVIGFLLALLLVTPARAAGDRHGSALREQHRSLERDLAGERQRNEQLRVENRRLQTRHDQTLAERDNLNSRLASVQQAVTAPVQETPVAATSARETPVTTEPVREMPAVTTPTRESEARDAIAHNERPDVVQREEPVASDRVPEQQAVTADERVQSESVTQPRLGERLRGIFGGQQAAEEEETDRLNSRGPAPTM